MAPHPPKSGLPRRDAEVDEQEVQNIIDRAMSLPNKNPTKTLPRDYARSPALNNVYEKRQEVQVATMTVIVGSPPTTTTVVTTTATVGNPDSQPSPTDTSTQSTSSPNLSGGAIAGIVIGSVFGLLLLIWILRSCSNLGAPPTDTPPDGRGAWYDGVRPAAYGPPPDSPRTPYRHSHSRHRSRSGHHHHHAHHGHHYRRSGSIGRERVAEVREVQPVAVVRSSSRRRASRSPYRMYETEPGTGWDNTTGRRGRSPGRSRSRSKSGGYRY